jgi:hypothetical protein
VKISNYRVFSTDKPINTPHPRIDEDLEETDHGFEKEVEVNDRPIYNRGGESEGTQQLEHFLSIIRNEIENPLPA